MSTPLVHPPCPGAVSNPDHGVIVFGNSLTDTGNAAAIVGPVTYKQQHPEIVCGAFSNGPLWIQYLTRRLNLCYRLGFVDSLASITPDSLLPAPPLISNNAAVALDSNPSALLHGFVNTPIPCSPINAFVNTVTNYAVAGATITAEANPTLPWERLSAQVDKFLADVARLQAAAGATNACNGGTELKAAVANLPDLSVIFAIGANDFDAIFTSLVEFVLGNTCIPPASITDAQLAALIPSYLIPEYLAQWTRVAAVTNRSARFLVSNVVDLTATPTFRRNVVPAILNCPNWTEADAIAVGQRLLDIYSAQLRAQIDSWNLANRAPFIVLYDVEAISRSIAAEPYLHGITILSEQPVWQGTPVVRNPYFAQNPSGRYAGFWDELHPTTTSHYAIYEATVLLFGYRAATQDCAWWV